MLFNLGLEEELSYVCHQLDVIHLFSHLKMHEDEWNGLIRYHEVSVQLLKDGFQAFSTVDWLLVQTDMETLVDQELVLMVTWLR